MVSRAHCPRLKRALALTVCVALVASLVPGCSGGAPRLPSPDGGGAVGQAAGGKVLLPDGCSLALTNLKTVGCLGASGVGADGGFTLGMPAGGPAQVCLTDRQNRLILFGFVDANDPKGGEISPLMTAVALLYRATGLCLVPPDYRAELLALLADSPEAHAAADVIAARVALNPTAMWDGDDVIVEAVKDARDALYAAAGVPAAAYASSAMPSPPPPVQMGGFRVEVSPAGVSSIVIDDTATESGLTIRHHPSGQGIQIENAYRRHTWYMVYRTDYEYEDGQKHAVNPWQLETEGYLPATGSIGNPIGLLVDVIGGLWTGSFPWAPNYSDRIDLPIKPTDAATTYYQVVIAGPSFFIGDDRPLDYPQGTPHEEHWADMYTLATSITFVKDMLLPVVGTFLPSDAIGQQMNLTPAELNEVCGDIMKLVLAISADVGVNYQSGDWRAVTVACVKQLASSGLFRKWFFDILAKKGLVHLSTQIVLTEIGENANAALKLTDTLLTILDLGMVSGHCAASYPHSLWPVRANAPDVRIDPEEATVGPGETTVFTAHKSDVGAQFYSYRWSTLGACGHLKGTGQEGDVVESTLDQNVSYVADDDAREGETDTVFLEITATMPDGSREPMGHAEAKVEIGFSRDYTLTPENPKIKEDGSVVFSLDIDPAFPGTVPIYYQWDATSSAGTLRDISGNPAPFTSQNSTAKFKADKDKTGSDTVTVKVIKGLPPDGKVLHQASTKVTVESGKMATIRFVSTGPNIYSDAKGTWHYGGWWHVIAVWKGDKVSRVLYHRPGDPPEGVREDLPKKWQNTKDEAIAYFGSNFWGLGDDEVAFSLAGLGVHGERDAGTPGASAEEMLNSFNLKYPNWPLTSQGRERREEAMATTVEVF